MKHHRNRREVLNRNAIIKAFSGWLLATSLAVFGTGVIEVLVDTPRLTGLKAIWLMIAGFFTLAASCLILTLMEDPDDARHLGHKSKRFARRSNDRNVNR